MESRAGLAIVAEEARLIVADERTAAAALKPADAE